ncbi:MAG TPA: acyltransferase family protein [Egibacteraceae bacterium]|nr:acyltransferase family protein [Egibacteraceae bacterium]
MTATPGVSDPARQDYRRDIDGLRAVAILLVVAFHARVPGFRGGFVGVDVFFVLSGYLITGLLVREHVREGRVALGRFVARRIRRLLPLAALVLASTVALGVWLLPPLQRLGLFGDAISSALYVANWRFAGQATAYSDAEVTDALLLHYWSLSIEEQFYVLWPLLLIVVGAAVRRRWPHLFLPALAVVLALIIATSLTASAALSYRLGPQAYYTTHTRLWEMAAGALLAVALPRLRPLQPRTTELLAVLGVGSILWSAVRFDAGTTFPGTAALLPVLGCLALITAGDMTRSSVSKALTMAPLPHLGRLSYAWYLWHWPVIGAGMLLQQRYAPEASAALAISAAVGVSLLLAALSHVLVENPVRYSPRMSASLPRSYALGAALTLAPALVGVVLLTGYAGLDAETVFTGEQGRQADNSEVSVAEALQASNDRVTIEGDGCRTLLEEAPEPSDCIYGDPAGSRTIGLVGDSHAQHWLPALHEAGKLKGWRVVMYMQESCTLIDVPIWHRRLERRYHECEAWRTAVVDQLRAHAPLDLLLIARTYRYKDLVLGSHGERLDVVDIRQPWIDGARRMFASASTVADHVAVLRDTPWAPHDIPSCLSDTADSTACAFPLGEAAHRDTPLHQAEVAAGDSGAGTLDLTDLVCPSDPCEVVTQDGIIKMRDSHHLSQTFSTTLGSSLADRIERHLAEHAP